MPSDARYAANSVALEFLPVAVTAGGVDAETVRGPLAMFVQVWYIYYGWLILSGIGFLLWLVSIFAPQLVPDILKESLNKR